MEDKSVVETVKSPKELQKLNEEQLEQLCSEIRRIIVSVVSKNGGHLASNLGTVELTVALHRVFGNEGDSLVWDVGHQSYTHKILTGRLDDIYSIRTEGGISGFPKREESPYDAFNVGHSSTSISAAFGIAVAKQLRSLSGSTVAIIGDGALSGGLAFEGLNNAGKFKKNFIVVLNDNKMSISRNVGALARYLGGIRMSPKYLRLKSRVERVLIKTPILGSPVRKLLKRSKSRMRNLVYKRTIFDDLGFAYYGPVDGHNIQELERAFLAAKSVNGPVMVHVVTTKGKGYTFAENDPKSFHGVGSFDIDTGESISSKRDFSGVFGDNLLDLAYDNDNICAITAAMATGTGLVKFAKKHKERFFDVGIAEEHAVTFACGLAVKGMIPVFAVYSTFLQRSIDQIIHDAAMQNLHIILAVDRAGVVGTDGETHQGVFDVALLNSVPNITIYSPCYFDELEYNLRAAIYSDSGVVAVRYPKGGQPYKPLDYNCTNNSFDFYGDKNASVLLVTYGKLFSKACRALEMLKESGKSLCILKLNRIKPVDTKAIMQSLKFKKILFFEEGMKSGGVGESFEIKLDELDYCGKCKVFAIEDEFVKQASVDRSLEKLGLDEKSMADAVLQAEQEV
ncbi:MULTISPECIES: 1-deoxy-D-xylulose-5-phosphate synthase [unclassified Ruminococcus]|uniref:1-deoxy-D-xylulose-5-phosphate synthase n=1 Tax=unclassified Ruminococcus TaxID=2608920 RepID=UPI00210D3D8A|nr:MULTISPECIES: 1-deoxy-D-xylulose-5-phosphate synthase [unclassified Ruminococcus]MCQ4022258.1 1-deoxy-D-xylulose-5-phosphate synthase [Ruminococcus sp. zg-924]MCQ4114586.1 1-deoxy-D-xylulose-5-phosphate synthase [Ruminococcus sp. zg-921]